MPFLPSLKKRLVQLALLPLLPLRPFVYFFQARARTTRVLRRVLYVFAAMGLPLSLFAGVFVLGKLVEGVPEVKQVWAGGDAMIWVTVLAAATPFVLLSVLTGAAAHRVLRQAPHGPLAGTPGLEPMDLLVRVFFGSLSLVLLAALVNLSALAMVAVGSLVAVFGTIFYLMFALLLIVCTLGFVLAGNGLQVSATLDRIWDTCTFARMLFQYEERALAALDLDPSWAALAAILYGYGVPAVLAIWIWRRRQEISGEPPVGASA